MQEGKVTAVVKNWKNKNRMVFITYNDWGIMNTLDTVNKKMGKNKVKFAVQGSQNKSTSWRMERNTLSLLYD